MSKVVPGEVVVAGEVRRVVDVEPTGASSTRNRRRMRRRRGPVAVQPQKSTGASTSRGASSPNTASVKDGAGAAPRPKRPTKKDGKPAGFRWDGEVQKWVSNRSNEAGGPPADGQPSKNPRSATAHLLRLLPCAVGYFLWVSAPACWAAPARMTAPVGSFVHDPLLVPLGKCLRRAGTSGARLHGAL